MGQSDNRRRRKKKKSPLGTFIKIVVSMVLIFLVLASIGVFAYFKLAEKPDENQKETKTPSVSGTNLNFLDSLMKKNMQLNIAVFGTDKDGTRTDVIFVIHFDSKTGEVGLLSIPRDTRVTLSDSVVSLLKENGRNYSSVCKINAVHAYGGKENGPIAAVMQLEDLLGIKIDHYVEVDLEAFRALVDAIGGVEVDVPQRMYYNDPFQDLYIDLQPGLQQMDGKKAEQLVRFRSYPEGDVARVQVQQLFLKAFANKVLSTETLMNNIPDLISIAFNYVKTDLGIGDALKYANYIKEVSMDDISMETLPGQGQYVGDVSYFLHDEEEMKAAVDRLFYGAKEEEKEETGLPTSEIDSREENLRIEVANGGIISGLAGRTQEKLLAEGFNVVQISTYNGTQEQKTRIIVSEDGMGGDLTEYFPSSTILVDPEQLSKDTDIKIILGLNEE